MSARKPRPWLRLKARFKALLLAPLLLAIPLGMPIAYFAASAALSTLGVDPSAPLNSQSRGLLALNVSLGILILSCATCGLLLYVLLGAALRHRGYTRAEIRRIRTDEEYPATWVKDEEC